MGIRFYCPNGHKLNVKAFQAGQTGICPVCGAKMQIPLESTRPSSREQRRNAPVTARDVEKGTDPICAQHPEGRSGKLDLSPFPPAGPSDEAAGRAAADPLAAEATWYVRPATGGQFGPATSEIMRIWLAEGRIAADTLVWRDGWRDWQEAQRVFGQAPPSGVVDGPECGNGDRSNLSEDQRRPPLRGGAGPAPASGPFRQIGPVPFSEPQPNARRMLLTVGVIAGLVLLGIGAVLLAFFWGHR
jgi:hypothetical protein